MSTRTERVLLVTLLIVTGSAFLFTTLRVARERADTDHRHHQLTLIRSMRLALNATLDTQMRAVLCRDAKQFRQLKEESEVNLNAYRISAAELSSVSDKNQTNVERLAAEFADIENTHRQVMELAERSSNRRAMNLAIGPCVEQLQGIGLELGYPQIDSATERMADPAETLASTQLLLALHQYQTLLIAHILEPSKEAMAEFERQLARLDQQADDALKALAKGAAKSVPARVDSLRELHREIIKLSRENTNIRAEELAMHSQLAAIGKLEATLEQLEKSLDRSLPSSVVPQHSAH